MVEKFSIPNAGGKKVHIHDHLNTRVKDDDELKYLLTTKSKSLILKVCFFDPESKDILILSEVSFCC